MCYDLLAEISHKVEEEKRVKQTQCMRQAQSLARTNKDKYKLFISINYDKLSSNALFLPCRTTFKNAREKKRYIYI